MSMALIVRSSRAVNLAAILTLLVMFVFGVGPVLAQSRLETLSIETSGGVRAFDVEVMDNDADRARGLMFRPYLPRTRGMLFDFKAPLTVMMWMKDTLIPLDMLFIRKDGSIARIAENAEPHSTRTIASGEPILAVLEINGGLSAQLGIKAGDKVRHPLFSQ